MRGFPLFLLLSATAFAQAPTTVLSSTSFANGVLGYDQARSRLVIGGTFGMWEWDGVRWGKSHAWPPALPRNTVYDEARQRLMIVCDTRFCSYDGHAFVDHGPMPSTANFVLCSDRHRARIVAMQVGFGGAYSFEWDGTSWQQIAMPGTLLMPLGVAYDAARQRTVATTAQFGGSMETWEWDGTSWTLRATNTAAHTPLVFDPVRQQVISTNGATWAWDGSTWTQSPVTTPTQLSRSVADPARGVVWAAGASRELWTWNGTAWSATLPFPHPELTTAGFSFDSGRGRAVLFGGTYTPQHREWDGNGWHDLSGIAGPPPRQYHGQVFDAVRGETVVFGGGGPASLGDTWAWNGTTWRQAAPGGPLPRRQPAMAFDIVRGVVVLVGGVDLATTFADHWEWNGAAWTQVGGTTPMGPVLGALGFDILRNRLVFLDDLGNTWEHAGGWASVASGALVTYQSVRSLVWDVSRQRLQGTLYTYPGPASQYEWDGATWTQRGYFRGALAYDTPRMAMLSYRRDALFTETTLPAGASDVGAPCGTSHASLATFDTARPGNTAFHLDVRAGAAPSVGVIGYGLSVGNVALGNGCTLVVQNPITSTLLLTNTNGVAHLPVTLPADNSLRGVSFVAQAAVLDGTSPGGFVMTQGLLLTIGD